ncbi:MAG: hypothetical protein R3B74_01985 [Nitrospirales bacterium]|nr:hypothetical protein [Nitrospirales bacterium]
MRWQHCSPGAQWHGEAGLREVLAQLAGFEAPASSWESSLLAVRVANYKPEWLDNLCLRGEMAWGRLTPPVTRPAVSSSVRPANMDEIWTVETVGVVPASKPLTPTSLVPISFCRRQDLEWMLEIARPEKPLKSSVMRMPLSGVAQDIYECLTARGACFFSELKTRTSHLATEVEQALWELVAAGLATADGFDPLRALLDPRRRRAEGKDRARRPRHSAGRWSLLENHEKDSYDDESVPQHPHERWATQLARRYGVVFRDVLKRETLPVTWRELLIQYRKMEWKGEMRGGRFVNGYTGEQFALPEAVEALRAVRRDVQAGSQEVRLSHADPLNLIGIILPGERISPHISKPIIIRNGMPVAEPISIANMG